MAVTLVLTALTLLSVALLIWQFLAARRFPLYAKTAVPGFAPAITILKPLKGTDEHTHECLRSWLTQDYSGATQILFGVASEEDPACSVVRKLLAEYPHADAHLIVASETLGTNAKVSTLIQLERRAKHDVICVSDADVRVEPDFLANCVAPLKDPDVGLVNCFYRLANPTTLATRLEAVAVNADFWSQVLQSNTLKRQDFALGAVMMTRRKHLETIGGFASLADYLADDYQLGHRISATARIELCPQVVECWERPMTAAEVWSHQVRWARTIRVCQPVSYFFSILNNVTLWSVLLALFGHLGMVPLFATTESGEKFFPLLATRNADSHTIYSGFEAALLIGMSAICLRIIVGARLLHRFSPGGPDIAALAPIKDLFNAGVWLAAFCGTAVRWRGRTFGIQPGGKLVEKSAP